MCTGFSLVAERRRTGSAALQHGESSQTRDQTCVPYIGRQILNQWPTREVPILSILEQKVTATCSALISGWVSVGHELSLAVVCRLLAAVTSAVAEHALCTQVSVVGLRSCGTRA